MELCREILDYLWAACRRTGTILLTSLVPWMIYAVLMQFITGAARNRFAMIFGTRLYAYLTAPGVMLHEFSHALFCIIFGHKIVGMQIFAPEKNGTLGYVKHAFNPKNLLHRIGNFFIGTGPVWCGAAAIWLISFLLLPDDIFRPSNTFSDMLHQLANSFTGTWQAWLWLYLMLAISGHLTLSREDLNGASDGIFALVLTLFAAELLTGWKPSLHDTLQTRLLQVFPQCVLLMILPLAFAVLQAAAAFFLFSFCRNKNRR